MTSPIFRPRASAIQGVLGEEFPRAVRLAMLIDNGHNSLLCLDDSAAMRTPR